MVRHFYNTENIFEFEGGGSIDSLQVAYHTSETEYTADKKVIWICHALTANSDAEEWWSELVGKGKLFDTGKYFVICGNMLGSCYGSSGPSSINPDTGKPYFFDFPRVTVRDIVKALDLVRRHVGIGKIDLLIGASIGGFQALEWSVMCPEVISKAIYIATLGRVTPWLSAFEESQRMALEADPSFRQCADLNGGKSGMKCARSVALLSYRNEDGYNRKQKEEGDDTLFADRACSYQRYQGNKFAARFDAYSYYYLSYSVDSNNIGRGRGGVESALSSVRADSTVIAIDSDLIFPPEPMKAMAQTLGADFHIITSHFGHDGFLLEHGQLYEIIYPIVKSL